MTNKDKIKKELANLPEKSKEELKKNGIDITNVDHVKTFLSKELDTDTLDSISGGLSKKAKRIGGGAGGVGGGLGLFVHKKNKALDPIGALNKKGIGPTGSATQLKPGATLGKDNLFDKPIKGGSDSSSFNTDGSWDPKDFPDAKFTPSSASQGSISSDIDSSELLSKVEGMNDAVDGTSATSIAGASEAAEGVLGTIADIADKGEV